MREIDKKIIDKIINDNTIEHNSVDELREQLEQECSKKEPNYALIDELSIMIVELEGCDLNEADISERTDEISRKINISHRKIIPKWITAVSACLIIFLGLNIYSVHAWNMNIFSAAVKYGKDGVTIDLNEIELPTTEDDPYGIKAKCAECGFVPDTPSYIPDGFVLKDISINNGDSSDSIIFFYRKDDIKLNFNYINYKTSDEISPVSIPTDTYNITKEKINGRTTYILKEDKQFTAAFMDKRIKYTMFAEDLDYDECYKILENLS